VREGGREVEIMVQAVVRDGAEGHNGVKAHALWFDHHHVEVLGEVLACKKIRGGIRGGLRAMKLRVGVG
jgi:hypothetical protein